MRRFSVLLIVVLFSATALMASAADGKILKVLPHYLDAQGRHTLSPSLFDRDAYQARLRDNPEQRSGIRYDIRWRAQPVWGEARLRIELRGVTEGKIRRERTLEQVLPSGSSKARWAALALTGDDYRAFGEITAWRVTLWDGKTLVAEQKSFLW